MRRHPPISCIWRDGTDSVSVHRAAIPKTVPMNVPKAHILVIALLIAPALSLTGCTEDFAVPEKGVYRGAEPAQLDEDTRHQLHGRARYQKYN